MKSKITAPNIKTLKANHWYHERDLCMSHDMFRSKAFLEMTHTSKIWLMLLLHRREWDWIGMGRRKKRIFINDNLKMPYSEAEQYGMSTKQIRRAIVENYERGFIDIPTQGGQFQGKRKCNEYTVVDDWKLFGTPGFVKRTAPQGACYSGSLKKHNQKNARSKGRGTQEKEVFDCHQRQPFDCRGGQPKTEKGSSKVVEIGTSTTADDEMVKTAIASRRALLQPNALKNLKAPKRGHR